MSTWNVKPQIQPPLDGEFVPALLFEREYFRRSQNLETHEFALIRHQGHSIRFELKLSSDAGLQKETEQYLVRTVKFYLWAIGGYQLQCRCSDIAFEILSRHFSNNGAREFDCQIMQRVYGHSFDLQKVDQIPDPIEMAQGLGGHLQGSRIGFDLGASDFKLAAIENGEVLFTDEVPWQPVEQADPDYHYKKVISGLEKAASFLKQVDGIGGSSAGIIQNNEFRVASLFRSVPLPEFEEKVIPFFHRIQEHFKVPVEVANDGDVSALAGAMSLNENGILGIAMGSSEAVGFLDKSGRITGQLNELAFAPIDFSEKAPEDEWSKDIGVGVQYFSQQAVNRLAVESGWNFDAEMRLPERLKLVQEKANNGDPEALKIFQTIGVYFGYTVPFYARFYDFNKLMVFGRVTSGKGGDVVVEWAQRVLDSEFNDLGIQISVPDEKFRRVGQAVAAASLPSLSPS